MNAGSSSLRRSTVRIVTLSGTHHAIGRLVAQENTCSDLLALLFELDHRPLVALFGLDADRPHRAQREVRAGRGRKSRLDFVLRTIDDDIPIVVIELKGASNVHGDQLERYDAWLEEWPLCKRFFGSLDKTASPRPGWTALHLTTMFAAWEDSSHPQARWIATQIAHVMHVWDTEADAEIGRASGWYVADLVTRRTVEELNLNQPNRARQRTASAYRTSAGNPMFMLREPHRETSIAVDVRCEGRGDAAHPWLFRPCVEVGTGQDLRSRRLAAHDLMVELSPRMGLSSVKDALGRVGVDDA